MQNGSNYTALINKLDEFIRKFYENELIKGVIYTVGILLVFFLSIAVIEYYGHFDTVVRSVLFYSFVLGSLFIIAKYIVVPLSHLYRFGKVISYEQAANIIGQHFAEVNDKLLNVLQLQSQYASSSQNMSLVEASINQKIKTLKPVPFTSAVDFKSNRKYLKIALTPLLIFVFILLKNQSIITDSTMRLVKHGTYFEKQAPFHFVIENADLKAIQYEDYELDVKLTGEEIPESAFINIDGIDYLLSKEDKLNLKHTFKNVQKTSSFYFHADGFESKTYELEVLPKPLLIDFDVALSYPAYTGKKNETLKNSGDLVIPAGTKVSWHFRTQNTAKLLLNFIDTTYALQPSSENVYTHSQRLLSSKNYAVLTANQFMKSKDSVLYSIQVIPDLFPTLEIEQKNDSLSPKRFYFRGAVKDDYGFSKLTFNYRFLNKQDSSGNKLPSILASDAIAINKSANTEQFYHAWDLSEVEMSPSEEIEYYFEVWDNDGVHGAKSTRSQAMVFKAPSLKELSASTEKNNDKIKSEMEQSISEAKALQKELEQLNKKVLEKKQLGWEEKKQLENLLEKQKDLQKKVENAKNENVKNTNEHNEFKKPDEDLLEKQKQLEELFKNIMTDDMKKLFEELQKLLSEMDKKKVQEAVDKMKLSNKDLEKELDRTLEVFKQLEFQQKLSENIEQLKEMAKQQEKLSNESQDKKSSSEEMKQKQDEQNKQFEEFRKEMDKLEEKNKVLESPNDIKNTDAKEQEIQQQQQQSSQDLKGGKNKSASQSQKKASEKMKEMAQELEKMQDEMEEQQNEEDMNALRQILENLVRLSFDQEALMGDVQKTETSNPQYVKLTQTQKSLKDDAKIIEDSLLALSKRVPEMASTVNREISLINSNMEKAIAAMAERQSSEAAQRQQFTMTSTNNLALILSEVLQQMQQQAQQQKQKKGGGVCKKPGKNPNPNSMANMRKMQQQLNGQIQKLKDGMQKGQGNKQGQGGISEEFAKLAAQQEMLRREMQKAMEELYKDGKGKQAGGDLMNKMEETETDLVNKVISQETIKRQEAILTRLLEHEKAEKEREMDDKRKSEEAKKEIYANPQKFFKYNTQKMKEAELLKTVPPMLSPFYKNKASEYFNNFSE